MLKEEARQNSGANTARHIGATAAAGSMFTM
jgi:hypothetical protein